MNAWLMHLPVLPIVVPLVAGAALLLVPDERRALRRVIAFASLLAQLGAAAALLYLSTDAVRDIWIDGVGVYAIGGWPPPFGIVLVVDRLSALMLILTSIVSLAALVYSLAGWERPQQPFHSLFQFLMMGLNGAFLTGDLFNLFVFFEVLLAASYGLLLRGVGPRRVRRTLHYIAVNLTASFLFLITMFAGEGVVLSTVSLLLQRRFGERVVLGSLALGVASAGGLLLGLRSVLAGTVGPVAGYLSDAHGRWSMITVSLILGIAGFGLLAYATSMWLVVLGIVLGAASGGAALATLAALVGDLAPSGRQGMVMGVYATAGDVGSTAGPFLAFALVSVVDLRWVYVLCSVIFLAGLLLTWRGRRARRP